MPESGQSDFSDETNEAQFTVASDNITKHNTKNARPSNSPHATEKRAKIYKKGIIYLSTIPPLMSVTKVTELMSQYGEVGRVFLQPAKSKKPGKPAKHFTEGWVEFMSKRVAKEVAASLNNTMIGGRKKSRYYDYMWNIKYLPRFKWVHLNERLEYERAVIKHKLRAEIEQAKRESNHFSHTVELSEKLKKSKRPKVANIDVKEHHSEVYKQRKTEEEITKKKKINKNKEDRRAFLEKLFVK